MSDIVPQHIGLILDGNRRWAKSQGLPQLEGHRTGFENLKLIAEQSFERDVSYVTAFIFSTENWNRTQEEVGYLMDLAYKMITRDLLETFKKGIRLVWIGSEENVSEKLVKALRNAEATTKDNTRGTLSLCFNYGGKKEITDAVKRMITDGVDAQEVTEKKIESYLYGPDVPAIDLLVRTSGEQRISNFMLWRAAYAELLFVDKHWPAFTVDDLDAAIEEFGQRSRRFGG